MIRPHGSPIINNYNIGFDTPKPLVYVTKVYVFEHVHFSRVTQSEHSGIHLNAGDRIDLTIDSLEDSNGADRGTCSSCKKIPDTGISLVSVWFPTSKTCDKAASC